MDEQQELRQGFYYRTTAASAELEERLGTLLSEVVTAARDGSLGEYLAARSLGGAGEEDQEQVVRKAAADLLSRKRLEGFFCPSCERLLMEDPDSEGSFLAFVEEPGSDED